jgi:hypothetical protein
MLRVCRHDNKKDGIVSCGNIFAVELHHHQGKTMNRNEMTPAERQIEKLKDYLLAVCIGAALAWFLVDALSK